MADDGNGKCIHNIQQVSGRDAAAGGPYLLGAGDHIIGKIEYVFYQEQGGQAQKIDYHKLIDTPMKHA
jgi:hypothetical protein